MLGNCNIKSVNIVYVNIINFVYPLESTVSVDDQNISECAVAAGCNNTEYLELAKKGGGHQGNCSYLYFPFWVITIYNINFGKL